MTPQRIVVFGFSALPLEERAAFDSLNRLYETECLTASFSLNHLDFLGDFDLAIVLHQPGVLDGFSLLKTLQIQRPHLPIIMVSKTMKPQEIIDALRSGATDFVLLPVQIEELTQCVERNIRKKVTPVEQESISISKVLKDIGKAILQHFQPAYSLRIRPEPFAVGSSNDAKSSDQGLRIYCFGALIFVVKGKAHVCSLPKKDKSLLAYLLFRHPKSYHRDQLMDRFWQSSTPESARNSLNVAIHRIRQWLHEIGVDGQCLYFKDNMYSLQWQQDVIMDVAQFLFYLRRAEEAEKKGLTSEALYDYHKAFAFYQEDFLYELQDEEWTGAERDRLRERYIFVLAKLGAYFISDKQYDIAINIFNKTLEHDPCIEQAHFALMQCYQAKGMRKMAIQQFQKCQQVLKEELNIKPSQEVRDLYDEICETTGVRALGS